MRIPAAAVAALLALALPGWAGETVAVAELDFTDTSGEVRDQAAEHAEKLRLFAGTLRAGLAEGGLAVVVPACDCSPRRTPFKEMAAATRAAGADLLLVGGIHKVSTLIGEGKLTLIDLAGDRVVCSRAFSYRGDDVQAWRRAAQFAAKDVLRACFPAPAG